VPRVSLPSELRVETSAPKSLGELPTALGITYGKSGSVHRFHPPHETAPEMAEAIAKSYKRAEEFEIDDPAITRIEYKPHAVGRPTDYTKKSPIIAFNFALLGLTDERIAAAMGIDVTTFYVWVKEKPEFSQALIDGRENVDGLVVNAMFKRAVGFKYDAVKILSEKGSPVYAPYEEYVPPDVNAAKYFLSIRRGKLRKDGWDDVNEGSNGPSSAVQVVINVNDPQEAAKQYREIMHTI